MSKNLKTSIAYLLAVLIAIFLLHGVYTVIDEKGDTALTAEKTVERFRDIETPGKKWLNGYFGVFFRFKYLGNINWLILPLLVYFFAGIRKRERRQLALVFVWLMTTLFISILGYDNYRYQFTLAPFTSAAVLLLLWEFLKDKPKYLKAFCFSLAALLCLYNIYHYSDVYRFYRDLRVTVKKPHFPDKLVTYLNTEGNVTSSSKVLAINQPLFFYHTNKQGIDFHGPYGWELVKFIERRKPASARRTRLFRILENELNVGYILLKSNEKQLYRPTLLTEFLDCETRLVLEDQGWFLYKLRDRSLEYTLESSRFKEIKVWHPRKRLPRNTAPEMKKIFRRGTFALDFSKFRKRNHLTVRNIEPGREGKRHIHFGYAFNENPGKKGKKIPRAKYVHIVVRASLPPHLMNPDNYVFISDYKDTWIAEKAFFTTPGWRTYLVSKELRPGISRLIVGFRFSPQSPKDEIKIMDVKLYVSDRPL
jgi:hypothetical protein